MTSNFDVIIVGGRVAGSTLAAYLAQQNIRVLIVEREQFPQPHPASSPMIQPVTLAMLDEIGADESAYARNTPRIQRMIGVDGELKLELPLPEVNGRNYGYAIDRARFDDALWDNAVQSPSVTGIQNFAVTNLLWDEAGERVIGIEGRERGSQETQTFTAGCVVGADGRFSLVARKVDAPELNRHDDHPTSLYYGYWENVAPYDGGTPTTVAYGSGTDRTTHGYLVMESADDTTCIAIEGRADFVAPEAGEIEAFYKNLLKHNPDVWARVENARLVTKVHGMRRVKNMYRPAGGPGWALVGDAYHQKDPIDGQGIFDAVYTARTLARAIGSWHRGNATWEETISWYDTEARSKTDPQYEMTLARVQQSMYPQLNLPIPKKVFEQPLKWLYNDPQYVERAGLALNRQVDPKSPLDMRFMMIAMLRGSLRDLSARLAE